MTAYRSPGKLAPEPARVALPAVQPGARERLVAGWLMLGARRSPEGRRLALSWPSERALQALGHSPRLRELTALEIDGWHHGALAPLLGSPYVDRLRSLELRGASPNPGVIDELAAGSELRALEALHIEAIELSLDRFESWQRADHLTGLKKLGLVDVRLTPANVTALLDSPALAGLEHLDLRANDVIVDRGKVLRRIATSFRELRRLRLSASMSYTRGRPLAPADFATLGDLRELEELDIAYCSLDSPHLAALAARALLKLRSLDLCGNLAVDHAGYEPLLRAVYGQLDALALALDRIDTAKLLAALPHDALRYLRIEEIHSPAHLEAFCGARHPRLEVLDLARSTAIGVGDVAALLARDESFPALRLLDLTGTAVTPGEAAALGRGFRVQRTNRNGVWLVREERPPSADGPSAPTHDPRASARAMCAHELVQHDTLHLEAFERAAELERPRVHGATSGWALVVRRYGRQLAIVLAAALAAAIALARVLVDVPGADGPRALSAAEQALSERVASASGASRLLWDPLRLVFDRGTALQFATLAAELGLAGLFLALLWRMLDEDWWAKRRAVTVCWLLVGLGLLLGTIRSGVAVDASSRSIQTEISLGWLVPVGRSSYSFDEVADVVIRPRSRKRSNGRYETTRRDVSIVLRGGESIDVGCVFGDDAASRQPAEELAAVVRALIAGRLPADRLDQSLPDEGSTKSRSTP